MSYFVRLASRARGIRITTPTRSVEQMMIVYVMEDEFILLIKFKYCIIGT